MSKVDVEFRRLLDIWLGNIEGEFAAPVEARKFMIWMRENEPETLEAWLDLHLVDLVTGVVSRRLRSDRALMRRNGAARAFHRAARTFEETGDGTPLSRYRRETYTVDEQGWRKSVGKMTGADHRFVANRYGRQGRKQTMLQAFHDALADLVGNRTTEEVLTEEKYDELYLSIVGRE